MINARWSYWVNPGPRSWLVSRRVAALSLVWSVFVAVGGTIMTASAINWANSRADRVSAFKESMLAVLCITVLIVAPTLLTRLVRPYLTLLVLAVTMTGAVVALAAGARVQPDLAVVFVIGFAAYELGRFALDRLGVRASASPLEALVMASGLGAGLLGLIGLALGLLGWLRLPAVLLLLAPLAAKAFWGCGNKLVRRARTHARYTFFALDGIPGWVDTVLLSLTMAFLAVGAILAVAPEVRSDAVRVHLPIVRAFVEQGQVPALDYLGGTVRWPVNGHVLYAMGFALHGQIAAKMLHTGAVWLAVATAGALGARYAGTTAGIAGAALVASLPVMVWEAGVGYVDALPVLFALLGALCLLHWQRDGRMPWLLLLGMMMGFGVASKLTFAFSGAALVLALLLVGRHGAPVRSRLIAIGWVVAGGLVVGGPWLARSIWLTGELPGLSLFLDAVGRGPSEAPASLGNLPGFGIGRDPLSLLTMPIDLTFRSHLFGENLPGFIGVALLLLLPTVVFLPRSRTTVTLAVVVLGQYLLWFLTAQYIRYLLPTLALLAVMLGAGFAGLLIMLGNQFGKVRRVGLPVVVGSLIAALSTSLLFFVAGISGRPGGLPVALVLGQQSQEAFLVSTLRDYELLRRLDRLVPPGTPVGALTTATAQLYTHAIVLTQFTDLPELLTASSETELFSALDREGVQFVIVDRPSLPPAWESSLVLQPDFLERHATTVFAANDVYLYRFQRSTRETAAGTTGEPLSFLTPGRMLFSPARRACRTA
jgi:hypothetical protein